MNTEQSSLINYFIAQTNKRFDSIDQKLDQLFEFKWKLIGGATLASFMTTIAVLVIKSFLFK